MASRALSAAFRRRLLDRGAVARPLRTGDVDPMLAEIAEPFSLAGRLFELKYDGFRMIAGKEDGRVRRRLRRGADATGRFPEAAESIGGLAARDLVLDTELVVLDEQGRPEFQRLQKRFVLRRAIDVAARPGPSPPASSRSTSWPRTASTCGRSRSWSARRRCARRSRARACAMSSTSSARERTSTARSSAAASRGSSPSAPCRATWPGAAPTG